MKTLVKYILLVITVFNFACQRDKPAQNSIKLRNHIDTISYSLGITIGQKLKKEGFSHLNDQVLITAIRQAMATDKSGNMLIDPDVAKDILKIYLYQEHKRRIKVKTTEWQNFLSKNAERPGVHVTKSGLQYEILRRGTGRRPGYNDYVIVKYQGYLPNGVVFDNNYTRTPVVVKVSKTIKGWKEALTKMREGAKWRIYLPPYLAFGNRQVGNIPPNSVVIYDIELMKIKHIK